MSGYGHEDRFAPTAEEWKAAWKAAIANRGEPRLTLPSDDPDDVLWAVAAALSERHLSEMGWCRCTHRIEAERFVDSLGFRGVEVRKGANWPRPLDGRR